MEPEINNAKAFRGGQASIGPRGPARDEYPSVMAQEVREGLTSIIYGRRSMHFERVGAAFERLTAALEDAEQDGFNFVLVNHSPQPVNGRGDVASTPSMAVPRATVFSLDSFFQSPI